MENVKVPENKNAPFIKRTINGQEFTVLIHFRAGCREKVQDKVKRMLRSSSFSSAKFEDSLFPYSV